MVSRVVIAAALGLTALAAAVALVTVMSVPRPGALLIERMPIDGMMLRQGMVGQQLSYSYSDIVQNEFPFAGRCRCAGVEGRDPNQRVVCACSEAGKDDMWGGGPWHIVTGYPIVHDKKEENPRDIGYYVTIQAMGYPDGPKMPPKFYTLVQPWDSMGGATMPEVYPDATLGVPNDAFLAFETGAPKGVYFSQRGAPPALSGVFRDRDSMLRSYPSLAILWQ